MAKTLEGINEDTTCIIWFPYSMEQNFIWFPYGMEQKRAKKDWRRRTWAFGM